MAYPKWVEKRVIGKPCPRCRSPLTAGAIYGVWISIFRRPDGVIGPGTAVLTRCSNESCEDSRAWWFQADRHEAVEALGEIFALARQPQRREAGQVIFDGGTWLRSLHPQQVRPSSEHAPQAPIEAWEVERFRPVLRRLSLKAGSRSLLGFIRRLGQRQRR